MKNQLNMEMTLEEYKKALEKAVETQEEQQVLQEMRKGDLEDYYEMKLSPRAVITGLQMGLI